MFAKAVLVATITLSALVNAAPTTDLVVRATVNKGDGTLSLLSIPRKLVTDLHPSLAVTWYDPGLGACGFTSGAGELVAAVSVPVYDGFPGATPNPNLNPICRKRARVTANGKSVDVIIVDKCMKCATGDIDLSPAAFTKLAPQSVGRIKGASWVFL
ncbi:hypothetical protein PQX77_003074 [Marasmius sp. AFHP31]|nr:hypothetical protein PQX77_003074 [Marasmius sp. AFHP31]